MRRGALSGIAVLAMLVAWPWCADAQVFKVQGGTSTLFEASGGSVEIAAPNYKATVGFGLVNGRLRTGASVETEMFGKPVRLGDDVLRFQLPTDVFDSGHQFLARGIGITHQLENGRIFGFAGTASQGFATPFFLAAQARESMGALFMEYQATPTVRLFSRSVFLKEKTLLQAVEWSPRKGIKAAATAGFGSDKPYGAASFTYSGPKLDFKTSFVAENSEFKRVKAPDYAASESERENISVTYRPSRRFSVTASHRNLLQPATDEEPALRASANEFVASGTVAKINVTGAVVSSAAGGMRATGMSLFGSRTMGRLSYTGGYFRNNSPLLQSSTMTGSVRFAFSQKLSLAQNVSRTNGQTTTSFGGDFTSNLLSFRADWQTVFVPLRLDRPVQQAFSVSGSVNMPGGTRLVAGSFVAPDGRMRYTFGISRYLYRTGSGPSPEQSVSFKFPKYVVSGVVVDETGAPVGGAAIAVGEEVAYTDSDGRFMVRTAKRGPFAIRVVAEEFVTPGMWEAVSAPSQVTAAPEETFAPIRIVIRRVVQAVSTTSAPRQ